MKLERVRGEEWRARTDDGVHAVVAGTADAPDAALEVTLRDIVSRWREVRAAIEAFVAALPASARIPLQPPLSGAFGAEDCGFDGELHFRSVAVRCRDAPSRATVTFYTGLPDGYVTFEVVLEGGRPVAIEAFAS